MANYNALLTPGANPGGALIDGISARQNQLARQQSMALAQQQDQREQQRFASQQNLLNRKIQQEDTQKGHEQEVAAAKMILYSQDPKATAERLYPQYVAGLRQSGQWDALDPNAIRQHAQRELEVSQAQLGQAPPVRMETVAGPRGSVIQVNPETNEQRQVVGPDNTETNTGLTAYQAERLKLQREANANKPPNPQEFARADKLRDEYNAASKDFVTIADNYSAIKTVAADKSAAGDLSLIFAYMKMLDPGSVVREQEFANAQNAGGVPDKVRAAYNHVLNGERLSANQRADFVNQANNLYKSKKQRHDSTIRSRYNDMAKRWNLNPDDVTGGFDVVDAQSAQPPRVVNFEDLP